MQSKKIDPLPTPEPVAGNSKEALRVLIAEALAICRAADPILEGMLANLLDMVAVSSTPIDLQSDRISALLAARRMFIYAHAEAHAEQDDLAEKLLLCIACLTEHIRQASPEATNVRVLPA